MNAYARNIEDRSQIFRLTKTLFTGLTDDISAGSVECVVAKTQAEAKQLFARRDFADLKTVARFFKGGKTVEAPTLSYGVPKRQPEREAVERKISVQRNLDEITWRDQPGRGRKQSRKVLKKAISSFGRRHRYRANPTEEHLWAYDVEDGEMFTVETKAELKEITPALITGDILLVRAIDPEAANYKFDRYEDHYITIVEAREWLTKY